MPTALGIFPIIRRDCERRGGGPEHCDAVAPGVLKVDGRAPRGQHDQLPPQLAPSAPGIAQRALSSI
eukprot:1090590-Rhodomonas_salina.4